MNYTIKVLSNTEFEELRFSRVHDALGVADPVTNEVYIRHTHIGELNRYLIDHELNHLVEETPTDELDGVRYKFTDNIFSGIKNIGGAIGSGLGSLGGVLSAPFTGAAKLAGGLFGGGGSGGQQSGFNPVQSQSIGGVPSFRSAPFRLPFPSGTSGGSGGGFGGGGGFGDALGGLFGRLGDLVKKYPQRAFGTGLLGVGLAKGLPKVPNLSAPYDQLKSQIQGGGSPLGQLAQSKVTENLNQKFEPLSDPEIEANLRQYKLQRQMDRLKIYDVYHNLMPGVSDSSSFIS